MWNRLQFKKNKLWQYGTNYPRLSSKLKCCALKQCYITVNFKFFLQREKLDLSVSNPSESYSPNGSSKSFFIFKYIDSKVFDICMVNINWFMFD